MNAAARLAPTSEDDWVARLRSGDEAAVEDLFCRYQPKAYSLCFGILRNEVEAREAAQEVLAEVARKISQFDGRSNLSTWIYRVVANHALMQLRACKRRREASLSADHRAETELPLGDGSAWRAAPRADQEVISADALEAMEKLCDQLPEKYCPIVALCNFQEIPLRLAAARLGLSMRGAKSRLHRGRVELRKLICGFGELCGPWCAR